MKILLANQIRELDEYTIRHEPIASIDLMERASHVFVNWFTKIFPDRKHPVHVFCGPGNNGGDGLAIARLLSQDHYSVKAYLLEIGQTRSEDCQANLDKLLKKRCCPLLQLITGAPLPELEKGDIVIDAIFGSGLSRPVEGYWANLINHLNQQPTTRVAVDIPSGMFADESTDGISIHADYSFSFEMPKLGFFFPENEERVGEWSFASIGLHRSFIENESTPFHLTKKEEVQDLLRRRNKFSHKGNFGHALLIAGSQGKIGAAVLSARAIMRSGAGLLTIHSPGCGYSILQTTVPEAMLSTDDNERIVSEVPGDLSKYNAIGIGPGIGTDRVTAKALEEILDQAKVPLVIDADALNIISTNSSLLKKIPQNSILTPHPKEFERLFGKSANGFERNQLQRQVAEKMGVIIVLKGANTAVALPDGTCHFNTTGNPGMATGGSGDVLTGVITGLLAQGYPAPEAAVFGVYLHGLAGDLAALEFGQEAMIANDVIEKLGQAYLALRS